MPRIDERKFNALRPVKIIPNYNKHAEGSALIEIGNTVVICTASVEDKVPPFLKNSGKGWVTAEYSMIPRSTQTRMQRESTKGKIGGRTHEIQRLIGRALRGVINMEALGERTIWIDCDVIQADGGTRTASITGSFVALSLAIDRLTKEGKIVNPKNKKPLNTASIIKDHIAAISVGIVNGKPLLDLNYQEDSDAEVDMNIVMTGKGKFVELQSTAEKIPFSEKDLKDLLSLAKKGIKELLKIQKSVIK